MKKLLAAGLISGAALFGIGGLAASCGDTGDPPAKKQPGVSREFGSKDASADVKTGDMTSPYGTIEIPVTITNHTSKTSDYHISATVYDANNVQVDTAETFVQNVAPGGKAHDKLIGMNGQNVDHYKVTVVDRTASP